MNSEFKFESHSEQQTEQLGMAIANATKPGQVFALNGDLGSGKTALTRSICSGLKVDSNDVNSPTFVLMQLYESADFKVAHFDTYRLADPDEFLAVGGEEYLLSDEYVCLIEWAERIEELLPNNRLDINIRQTAEDSRCFELRAHEQQSTDLLNHVARCVKTSRS